jgi:hypothetical protein
MKEYEGRDRMGVRRGVREEGMRGRKKREEVVV